MALKKITYETDGGIGYPMMQDEKFAATFTSGTADDAGKPSVTLQGFSRRRKGISPRSVSCKAGTPTATTTYKYRRFAVPKKTTFDSIAIGDTATIDSVVYTIVGKTNEQVD